MSDNIFGLDSRDVIIASSIVTIRSAIIRPRSYTDEDELLGNSAGGGFPSLRS